MAFLLTCIVLLTQSMAYGFGGPSVVLEKDHTHASLEGARVKEPLFVNSLPEQGHLLDKESFISSHEPTNRSKAEAPHLVVVRTGIRQTFWMVQGTSPLLSWVGLQKFPQRGHLLRFFYAGSNEKKTPIYLLIRNLRI
ncbi:MAG: hypothetical protein RLZZ114_802 [Bacteroidota bacterium]|jgi:hypothetical protein